MVKIKNGIGYSAGGKSLPVEIHNLEPNIQYQLTKGGGFRDLHDVPLKEYLIDFKTENE